MHNAREQPKPEHSETGVENMEQKAVLQTEDSVTPAVPVGSRLRAQLQGWEFITNTAVMCQRQNMILKLITEGKYSIPQL